MPPLNSPTDLTNEAAKSLILLTGAPYGNRTRVSAVKGRRPRPLDEGRVAARERAAVTARGHIKAFAAAGKKAAGAASATSAGRKER
jgi:hypothetical protein